MITALAFAAGMHAAPLNVVEVDSAGVNCLFNTNCAATTTDTLSPIVLPGSTGLGFLQTRTIAGGPGSLGEGLYGYLYRLDLTGIQSTNPPCTTNIVRCATNRVEVTTNILTCVTNVVAPSNEVRCQTRQFPATNIVFRFTNTIPATNFVRCITNVLGATECFTNFFPGTNIVFSFTNRLPATNITICQTNLNPGSNSVVCTTNRLRYFTNVFGCTTNTIPCPGTTPCISSLSLRFGTVTSTLDFDGDGTNEQAFLVTSGGPGTLSPASLEQSNGVITLYFSNGVCAGESSVFVGLVSTKAPRNVNAVLGLTSESNLVVAARAPKVRRDAITCDFGPLLQGIGALTPGDVSAPNAKVAADRIESLLDDADDAAKAADEGNLKKVLDNIEELTKRMDGRGNDWLRGNVANRIRAVLQDLLDCLQQFNRDSDHDDHDHDDDDDGHGHSKHDRD